MNLLSVRAATEMTPKLLNKICAHPEALSCGLGALFADAFFISLLSNEVPLIPVFSDWIAVLFLLIAIVAVSSLGCFFGLILFWPPLRLACSIFDGAPLSVGDCVRALCGPHAGKLAIVGDLSISQGGWKLANLDLGDETRVKYGDLFEFYKLLKQKAATQHCH